MMLEQWKNKQEKTMNPYEKCPTVKSKNFTFRLITKEDSDSIFECYHDKKAVAFMNDDNCDFGFYVDSKEQMSKTVSYWLDFYKQGAFIRFAVVDNTTEKAIGTVEGFGGEVGVLRIDISSSYEKETYIAEILDFAKANFYDYFGNKCLVTKAIPSTKERRSALEKNGWEFIDKFRDYRDYYKISL